MRRLSLKMFVPIFKITVGFVTLSQTQGCAFRYFNKETNTNAFNWNATSEKIASAVYGLTTMGQSLGLVNTTTSRAEWKAQVLMRPVMGTVPADPRELIENVLKPEFDKKKAQDGRFSLSKRDYVLTGFAAKTRTEYRYSVSYISKYGGVDRRSTLKLRVRDYLNMAYDSEDDFKGRRFTKSAAAATPTEVPNINDLKYKLPDNQQVRFWEFKENIDAFQTPQGSTVFVNKHRLALLKNDVEVMADRRSLALALQNSRFGGSTNFNIEDYWISDESIVRERIKSHFKSALTKLRSGIALPQLPLNEQEIDLGLVMVDLEKGKKLLSTNDNSLFRNRVYYLNYQLADFHKFMRMDDPFLGEPYIMNISELLKSKASHGSEKSLGNSSESAQAFIMDSEIDSILEKRKIRLKVLADNVQSWSDKMFETTQTLASASGIDKFVPAHILEYVRNSYEANFPVFVPNSSGSSDAGEYRMTKVQMTVDRDVTLSVLSADKQVYLPVGVNNRIFPKDLVVFEQKFDPDFIDISYDPLLPAKPNELKSTATKISLEKSWGLQKMYDLRRKIFSFPGADQKRSGKAADIPNFIPEKFFMSWADPLGKLQYMLQDGLQRQANTAALAYLSAKNTVDQVGWHFRQLLDTPNDNEKISFELLSQSEKDDKDSASEKDDAGY